MNSKLNNRNYSIKTRAIIYSLIGTIIINSFLCDLKKKNTDTPNYPIEAMEDLSIDDIKELIYTSVYLTDEEKDYLYNEDFLYDILPLINESIMSKIKYHNHLTDIGIKNYGMNDHGSDYLGYYSPLHPNKLFVRNYDDGNSHNDTLSHEFIHLCQSDGGYNTITEACAEIISNEYFTDAKMNVYTTQVKLIKKLMEIIGSEPIWIYNFTGNFKLIDEAIKPYLTENEYSVFLACLSFNHGDDKNNKSKFDTLNELIGTIYKNKYHEDITNNEVMQVLEDSSAKLTRYYFNKRYIDQEHSFYYKSSIKEFSKLDYETAMSRNLFYAYAVRYDPITYEEAMEAIYNNSFIVSRKIDFNKNNITISRSFNRASESRINAIIDGVEYIDVTIDYLVSEGIISANYYKVNHQILTAKEYLNHECIEGATIYTLYSQNDLVLYDDYIEGYMPKTIYLEPIKTDSATKKLTK